MTIQLPNTLLPIRRIYVTGLQLWVSAFAKVLPLFAAFFIWLSLPYLGSRQGILGLLINKAMPLWQSITYLAIYLLGLFVLYVAIYQRTYQVALGQNGSFSSSLATGFKKLPTLIVAGIISFVVITVLLAPGVCLATIVSVFHAPWIFHSNATPFLGLVGFYKVIIVLGLMLLIMPGAYFSLAISLFYPLLVIENLCNPFVGFKHFCQLIWGNWWRSIAVIFVPIFLLGLAGYAINLAGTQLGIHHIFGDRLWVFQVIVQTILSAIYLPLAAGIYIIQLNDLKLRRQQKLAGAPPVLSYNGKK